MPSSNRVLNDSKKGYSLKEKHDILHYIIRQGAHGEVKGRSFWMKMEKSKITARTWQSLKEVFLKRILPDLRNPYYKLTQQQIREFTRSNNSVPSNAVKWVEKNKAMDKILNRSMNEETESPKSNRRSNENKQDNKQNKSNTSSNSIESDFQNISFDDASVLTNDSQQSNNSLSQQSNVRITRNRDKENNLSTRDSQSSQQIESFPASQLLTSTPRKSLIQSKDNSTTTYKNVPELKRISPESKVKTPVKDSPSGKDNEKNKKSESKSSFAQTFSPDKILFLSSNDSSLSEDSTKKQRNMSKKNLFGFSSETANISANQVIPMSSETVISSEIQIKENKPTTSNYMSPTRPNKFAKRLKNFSHRVSSDSDDENGSSSDSQYAYYRSSDTESLKRKGKKLFGLFRGKLVPLYEPRKKCCSERRELIANGMVSKKRKVHKCKGPVYIDDELGQVVSNRTKNATNGDNLLSKEALNFWKLKYLAIKRKNDEILRLLAKQGNETYIDSVTKMLTDPIILPNAFNSAQDNQINNVILPDEQNKNTASNELIKRKPFLNSDLTKETRSGKKILITSEQPKNQATSSSSSNTEPNNVVVIDSQKADIIIDILKKVSEMSQPIDPVKVNKLIKSPALKSIMPPRQSRSNQASPKSKVLEKQTNNKVETTENLSDEILRLREKERQIFEKIANENVKEESNTERNLFSESDLEILFGDKEVVGKKKERDSSIENKKPNPSSKNLRSNKKVATESERQIEQRKVVGRPKSVNKNDTPAKSNTQTSKKQPAARASQGSLNMTNNMPESMDIEESVKFAINPKFFTILFPKEANDKGKNSSKEMILSSDDESTRYALPKTPSTQLKKKNKGSARKIIKLKMFSQLKKNKRHSLYNEDDFSELEENIDDDCKLYPSDVSSTESLEIPLQKFSFHKSFFDPESLQMENLLLSANLTKHKINVDKPLLEQDVETCYDVTEKPGGENTSCHFCNISSGNEQKIQNENSMPADHDQGKIKEDIEIDSSKSIANITYSFEEQTNAKKLEASLEEENYNTDENLDQSDIKELSKQSNSSTIDLLNKSISLFESDISTIELNTTHESMNIVITQRFNGQQILLDQDEAAIKRRIKELMSEEEDSN